MSISVTGFSTITESQCIELAVKNGCRISKAWSMAQTMRRPTAKPAPKPPVQPPTIIVHAHGGGAETVLAMPRAIGRGDCRACRGTGVVRKSDVLGRSCLLDCACARGGR